jgi:Na+/H+-dicarboxylate symporter
MDGTPLFQCVTTLFMAQVYGFELSIMSLLLIIFTVVAATLRKPAISRVGVIILTTVLQSAGIPIDGLIIIIINGIDCILGMFRTAVIMIDDLTDFIVFDEFYGIK